MTGQFQILDEPFIIYRSDACVYYLNDDFLDVKPIRLRDVEILMRF